MAFKRRHIERLLQQKFGFEPAANRSEDHRWYRLSLDGLPLIFTKVSHSKKDIGHRLESKIARQLHVRTPFFREMFECTRDLDQYREQIVNDPYPPWERQR